MAGLIMAAAGGLAGAGQEGAKIGAAFLDNSFKTEQAEAQALRETNLAKLNNAAADVRNDKSMAQQLALHTASETGQNTRQDRLMTQNLDLFKAGKDHAEALQRAGFTHSEELARTAADLQKTLSKDQIASHERIAMAQNANAWAIANAGGTITTSRDGSVIYIKKKDGSTESILDPITQKPLMGAKDLTDAQKAFVAVIGKQLVDLDRAELAAQNMNDTAALTGIRSKQATLNAQLLSQLIDPNQKEKAPASPTATGPAPDAASFAGKAKKEPPASAPGSNISSSTSYTPPADSVAGRTVASRGLVQAQIEAAEGKKAESAMNVRDQFNVDQRQMTARELASKYSVNSPEYSSLSTEQKSVLYKTRNAPSEK